LKKHARGGLEVMIMRLTMQRFIAEDRLLGFDAGDWSMLLGGLVLAGLLSILL
jgi:hypothetical protein